MFGKFPCLSLSRCLNLDIHGPSLLIQVDIPGNS